MAIATEMRPRDICRGACEQTLTSSKRSVKRGKNMRTHRFFIVSVFLAATLAAMALAASAAGAQDKNKGQAATQPSDGWAMAGGNVARTFQGEDLSIRAQPALLWKCEVMTPRERKRAEEWLLRDIVASRQWITVTCGRPMGPPLHGISIQDVIVGLSEKDGTREWMLEQSDMRGSVVAMDGSLLFLGSDGTARAVDCRRGMSVWQYGKVTASRRNTSDILYDAENLNVSMWGGRVAAMSRKDGQVLWRSTGFLSQDDEDENVRPWLAQHGDKLILADAQASIIRAMSCADSREVWTQELPSVRKTTTERIETNLGPIAAGTRETKLKSAPTARPCLMGDLVVIAGWYGLGVNEQPYVMAIHAANGQTAWKTPLGQRTEGLCPALATDGKHVYAVLASGKVRCLEGQSGKTAWETDLLWKEHPVKGNYSSFAFVGSLAISGDVLLVAGQPGFLNGLDLATGQKLWNIELPAPLDWNGIAIAGGKFLVLSGGSIMAFGPAQAGKHQ